MRKEDFKMVWQAGGMMFCPTCGEKIKIVHFGGGYDFIQDCECNLMNIGFERIRAENVKFDAYTGNPYRRNTKINATSHQE